jgi:hypothetical protein
VDCAPVNGGPVAIAEAGDPAGGDVVNVLINATNGTRDSQWFFTAVAVDPDAVVTDEGVAAGCSGESETTLEFSPREVHIDDMDGFHVCGTTQCEVHAAAWIVDENGDPVEGATVTFEMTAPDGSKTRKTAVTDEDGCAEVVFTVLSHETHSVDVVDVSGDGLEYVPDDNQRSGVDVDWDDEEDDDDDD